MNLNQLNDKTRTKLLFAIVAVYMGIGVFQLLFKVHIPEQILSYIQMALFVAVGMLIMSGRNKKKPIDEGTENENNNESK